MELIFTVDHQNIKRIDTNKVVADSKNYLYAKFVFLSEEWQGKTVTAIFKRGTEAYHVLLDSNMSCLVPAEVIKPNGFNVSVFAGDLVTCDKANVLVAFSGYADGGAVQPPTPDIYAQILARLDSISAGTVDEETVAAAVESCIQEHPELIAGGLTEDAVTDIVAAYVTEHKEELKGEPGEKGDPGADGITPHIGENGNWFIGDEDTGQPATGSGGTVSDEQVSQIVEKKITQAVNSIANPFETAYWKDSSDGNIYLVIMVNGALSIKKYESTADYDDILTDRLLMWRDEFEGDSLNMDNWDYELGYQRNNEPQNYTKEAVTVADSVCKITATKRSESVTENKYGADHEMTWDSGSITSKFKAMFKYGRIEAKVRHSAKQGSWPAFWLLGYGAAWPYAMEYDIFEFWGTGSTTKDYTYGIHYATSSNSHDNQGGTYELTTDTDWHIYACEVRENYVDFYLDGNLVDTIDFSNTSWWIGYGTYNTARVNSLNFMKHIILNMAVRPESTGKYPTHEDDMTMEIDWVRYYAPITITKEESVVTTALKYSPWSESNGNISLAKIPTINGNHRMALSIDFKNSSGNSIAYGMHSVDPFTFSEGAEDIITINDTVNNITFQGDSGLIVNNTGSFTVSTKIDGMDVEKTFNIIE